MVDGDLFDKLEEIARRLKRSNKPFGGIQVWHSPMLHFSWMQYNLKTLF
jgi:hypothetical protein